MNVLSIIFFAPYKKIIFEQNNSKNNMPSTFKIIFWQNSFEGTVLRISKNYVIDWSKIELDEL